MFEVTFSEFALTDYFTVENIHRSILPPREVSLLDIPVRHGAYFQNSRYGVREISIDILVKGRTPVELMTLMRFLAYCLDIERPTELSFSDEPDRFYFAILSDKTDVEEIMTVGRGTLTFLCPDPFGYSMELKSVVPTEGYYLFDNQGTTTTFPTFQTTFGGPASFLSLTSPDGVILVGSPAEVDKTKVPAKQTILSDPMRSLEGWTNAGNILDADRVNVGSIAVLPTDQEEIYASDYGTGPRWHGPGFRKTFSTPVKDFTFKSRIHHHSWDGTSKLDGDQRGRVEVYLFSASGKKIGKLVMRDSHVNYEFNIPEIFIGNETFLESEPNAPGQKKVSQKEYTYHTTTKTETVDSIIKKYKISLASFRSLNGLPGSVTAKTTYAKGRKFKVASKTVTKMVYPEHVGSWNDFYGEFTLQRVGSTWYAEVSRMDGNMKKTRTIKKTYVDKAGKYPKDEVAFVVISFLQWSTGAVSRHMAVTHLQLEKHNTVTTGQSPTIFQAGDVLEIDTNSSMVHLNGDLFMNELDIGSTFFPIYEGQTEVKVNTDDSTAIHSADYMERFL